jgi:polysaccharide export outer membrane protein
MRPCDLLPLALLGLSLTGCGGAAAYLWVDEVPLTEIADPAPRPYVIAAGDVLSIRVYNQDALSTRARVRPDGKIGVPLAGELDAAGRRPVDLAREVEAQLKPFVVAPAVVVSVEEVQPIQVAVLGEVTRPGVYALEPGAGVLQAIATAGGASDFADRERIFLLRKRPAQAPLRIRFTYAKLAGGEGRGAGLTLVAGDVLMLE